MDPLEIRIDPLAARGKAEALTSATPVSFRADLRTESAPIADLLNTAHAFDVARDVSATGTASVVLHIEGRGDSLASSGHLSGRSLVLDQVTLDDVESNFKFAGRTLHLDDIHAHAYGGGVAGTAIVETGGPGLRISAAPKLSDVDAKRLLAATTAVKVLSGKLSGVADVQFAPVPGRNAATGLSGTVAVLITGGEISGVRILDDLSLLGRFLSPARTNATSGTAFSKLAGKLRIQSGVARTDDLHMDFDGGALSATGTANLADETLDLAVSALLSKDVSQAVGGTRVGGFMTTVMASPRGELMIPAKVTGTFSKPRFQPDPARLLKMHFGSVDSAAATAEGLLDQFTKSKGDKANPFSELLNSLKPPAK